LWNAPAQGGLLWLGPPAHMAGNYKTSLCFIILGHFSKFLMLPGGGQGGLNYYIRWCSSTTRQYQWFLFFLIYFIFPIFSMSKSWCSSTKLSKISWIYTNFICSKIFPISSLKNDEILPGKEKKTLSITLQ
jgi:hypothetical protein